MTSTSNRSYKSIFASLCQIGHKLLRQDLVKIQINTKFISAFPSFSFLLSLKNHDQIVLTKEKEKETFMLQVVAAIIKSRNMKHRKAIDIALNINNFKLVRRNETTLKTKQKNKRKKQDLFKEFLAECNHYIKKKHKHFGGE